MNALISTDRVYNTVAVQAAMKLRTIAIALSLASLAPLAQPARADTATAHALFAEGRKLAAEGKYDEACPKFEESYRAEPGIGTGYNLADCNEHRGRTASAWAGYREVAANARLAGQPAREKAALERADKLESRLCKLRIAVASKTQGLEVKRSGEVIGAGQWGVAVPVDPGELRIDATATGKKPWSALVAVRDCPSLVVVAVPDLADAPRAVDPVAPTPPSQREPRRTDDPRPRATPSDGKTERTLAWAALAGAGLFAIGGGAAMLLRQGQVDAYNGNVTCPGRSAANQPVVCADYMSSERAWSTVGTVSLVTAGVLAATSLTLFLVAPRSPSNAQLSCAAMAAGEGASCTLLRRF